MDLLDIYGTNAARFVVASAGKTIKHISVLERVSLGNLLEVAFEDGSGFVMAPIKERQCIASDSGLTALPGEVFGGGVSVECADGIMSISILLGSGRKVEVAKYADDFDGFYYMIVDDTAALDKGVS